MCGINEDVSCLSLTRFFIRLDIDGYTEILSNLVDTKRNYLSSQRLLRFLNRISPSSLPFQSRSEKKRHGK